MRSPDAYSDDEYARLEREWSDRQEAGEFDDDELDPDPELECESVSH